MNSRRVVLREYSPFLLLSKEPGQRSLISDICPEAVCTYVTGTGAGGCCREPMGDAVYIEAAAVTNISQSVCVPVLQVFALLVSRLC